MAIGTQTDNDEMMSEINMIPFIDVMLVLLIIFINIELPQASMEKVLDKPENIRLSVDADGVYYWNDQRVDDAEFANRLTAAAAQDPQPELHIRGDKAVRYERVAQAMASAQRTGVRKIGFITEPTAP
jgi:biopolymer transport protein ExbD